MDVLVHGRYYPAQKKGCERNKTREWRIVRKARARQKLYFSLPVVAGRRFAERAILGDIP